MDIELVKENMLEKQVSLLPYQRSFQTGEGDFHLGQDCLALVEPHPHGKSPGSADRMWLKGHSVNFSPAAAVLPGHLHRQLHGRFSLPVWRE
jgi:hypothetical protein